MTITLEDIDDVDPTIAEKLREVYMYPNRPAGGRVIAHTYTYRIYIIRGKRESRRAKIIDSYYLPESSEFLIKTKRAC